ncbi:MAG: helix-turn-helix transcriptional regulator [Clostridia bacterium]|jgi:transcriptional regulator with XRE-family HTH domain|nr:helix-turn-helix transcriptional regulator [Clostridia bacterium]
MDNTTNNNTGNIILGQNVKNIRLGLNLTQEKFAEQLNLNSQFISQIETGRVGISIDNAINICNLANCSPTVLFKDLVNSSSSNMIDNYELLNERDKSVVNQMIVYLLNTK